MRVVALLSLMFGFIGLMLLDGQVFAHAVMGIVFGLLAVGCGLLSAWRDRVDKVCRRVGGTLAAFGVLLLALSLTELPGAYERQAKFNERRSPGHADAPP